MAFSKRFPKDIPTSPYPQWIEVALSKEEEQVVEQATRQKHAQQLAQALKDAKEIAKKSSLHADPSELVALARALFDKQASHVAFYKEEAAKEKFDKSSKTTS
jgi:leucyl aminopeptidase